MSSENRALYRRKFDIAEAAFAGRFGFYRPAGGFFLWLDVGDGEAAALRLWRDAAIRVLPGGYTARAANGGVNPGRATISAWRSCMTRRRSTPPSRGSAGCCSEDRSRRRGFRGKAGARE